MTINALNSGTRVWLADFADASAPTWGNVISGQLNLLDAYARRIDFTSPDGKTYVLRPADELATVVMRPRGWHLEERHLRIDGCFDQVLGERPNQKDRLREDVSVTAAELIAIDSLDASPTYPGLVNAVQVGVRYIEAWLRGLGAVAIFPLMEDAATAEISRSQLWQWSNAGVVLDNGERVTADLVREVATRELGAIRTEVDDDAFAAGAWQRAHDLLLRVALDEDYVDFLPLPAYELLD